jgi:hypothetical protein
LELEVQSGRAGALFFANKTSNLARIEGRGQSAIGKERQAVIVRQGNKKDWGFAGNRTQADRASHIYTAGYKLVTRLFFNTLSILCPSIFSRTGVGAARHFTGAAKITQTHYYYLHSAFVQVAQILKHLRKLLFKP